MRDELNNGDICGIIFWRDLTIDEMKEWLKPPTSRPSSDQSIVTSNVFSGWMKIELVCTPERYRGKKIGTMLVASALVWSAKVTLD